MSGKHFRIKILPHRVDAIRPIIGQIQAVGRVQAGYLDAEHLAQFALEDLRARDNLTQAGEHAAIARHAHPQGNDGIPRAEMVEHFHFFRLGTQVQANDGR